MICELRSLDKCPEPIRDYLFIKNFEKHENKSLVINNMCRWSKPCSRNSNPCSSQDPSGSGRIELECNKIETNFNESESRHTNFSVTHNIGVLDPRDDQSTI